VGCAIFSLATSWHRFWSFGSLADIGVSLFGGVVSTADLVRRGMYRATSNIYEVNFDVAPRGESMLCYLDDSVNMLGDILAMRPWKNSTCTHLATVPCTLTNDTYGHSSCEPEASCIMH
jgi:hypothetical protein